MVITSGSSVFMKRHVSRVQSTDGERRLIPIKSGFFSLMVFIFFCGSRIISELKPFDFRYDERIRTPSLSSTSLWTKIMLLMFTPLI